ncbi:MAG: polysaccharide deacetylase [Nakamurella sp.]
MAFDGAGWHEKWQYWFGIGQKVPFHFTANLTGLYLLDQAHKDYYHGPGHKPGTTSLGAWNTPDEVKQEVLDLNAAYAKGDEIGSHFMGHFCSDNPPGANVWTTKDWDSDLDQFFDVWNNYRKVDQVPGMPTLKIPASEVVGERTPCLQGTQEKLYPALVAHHIVYDESFTRRGIVWPDQSPKYKIWGMGMAEFPMHGSIPQYGTNHFQITMDYNFWYSQEYSASTGQMKKVTQTQSNADAAQVTATYQDMLAGAMAGSHAPLLLGNHFNDWNNNAYTAALGNFLLANCAKSGVHCVPFRDVVDWMNFQDPKVMAQLHGEPPILGPAGSNTH